MPSGRPEAPSFLWSARPLAMEPRAWYRPRSPCPCPPLPRTSTLQSPPRLGPSEATAGRARLNPVARLCIKLDSVESVNKMACHGWIRHVPGRDMYKSATAAPQQCQSPPLSPQPTSAILTRTNRSQFSSENHRSLLPSGLILCKRGCISLFPCPNSRVFGQSSPCSLPARRCSGTVPARCVPR